MNLRNALKYAAIAGGALLLATEAQSEVALHGGGWSTHLLTDNDYTSSHDLIGVEAGPVLVATFRNSYGRRSYLAGYGWDKQWGDVRGSVHLGAVHGYRSCYGDRGDKAQLCPAIVPALHYTRYRVQPGVVLFGEALAITVRVSFR